MYVRCSCAVSNCTNAVYIIHPLIFLETNMLIRDQRKLNAVGVFPLVQRVSVTAPFAAAFSEMKKEMK